MKLTLRNAATSLDEPVRQGRFAMIDVGNNAKISNVFHTCFRVENVPMRFSQLGSYCLMPSTDRVSRSYGTAKAAEPRFLVGSSLTCTDSSAEIAL